MASFSWEMVVRVWVNPLNACETVTSPLTSWARREMVVDSGRRGPESVFASKSGRSCEVWRRAFLACVSCCAMKARGCSIEGVPDRDGMGELRADIIRKAGFPGGMSWGSAMRVSRLEKWARGLIRKPSGVKLSLYVKCRGGEEVCEKRAYLLGVFFLFFFFFFLFL